MRRVVVLPAPFGPRNPVSTPGSTSKVSALTAVTAPYRLVSPRTAIVPFTSVHLVHDWVSLMPGPAWRSGATVSPAAGGNVGYRVRGIRPAAYRERGSGA
jgi:hypothetical protein